MMLVPFLFLIPRQLDQSAQTPEAAVRVESAAFATAQLTPRLTTKFGRWDDLYFAFRLFCGHVFV
jgi:hypothetical protein